MSADNVFCLDFYVLIVYRFGLPSSLRVDEQGNFLVTDLGHQVLTFNVNGSYSLTYTYTIELFSN